MTFPVAIAISAWLAVLFYRDCRFRTLPNVLTLGGALVALVARLGFGGWGEFKIGLVGGLVCALFILLPFLLNGAGGGDVKMLFAVGCMLGLERAPAVMVYTSIAGLVMVVVMLAGGLADGRRLKHCFRSLFDWRYDRLAGKASLPPKDDERSRIPFGAAIALGSWMAMFLDI